MTSLTLLTAIIALYGMFGRRGYALAISAGGATAAGAALTLGSVVVPTFFALAAGAAVIVALRAIRKKAPGETLPPGVGLLAAYAAYSISVTLIAPFLFRGTRTVTVSHFVLEPGVLNSSNIAQILYTLLGVCVVIVIASDRRSGVGLIGVAAGGGILLSFWRYTHLNFGVPFPEGFFDNSPAFAYIETAAGGVVRFRGIFSEPAALAVVCLVTIAYGLSRFSQVSGPRRAGLIFIIMGAAYMGVLSTSTTFLVASGVLTLIAALTALFAFLAHKTRLRVALGLVGCGLVVLGLWVAPIVAEFVESAVETKVAASSYDERSNADLDSYGIFLHSWGIGLGLGSGRASSSISTLLSTVGLPGVLLLAVLITGLIARVGGVIRYRPAVWALVALLTVKAISGPDLSDTTGLFWICLGVLSGAAARESVRRADTVEVAARAGSAPGGSAAGILSPPIALRTDVVRKEAE